MLNLILQPTKREVKIAKEVKEPILYSFYKYARLV